MAIRTALVVGVGSKSGLGAALARRFAREGLSVAIAGRNSEHLKAVAAEIRAKRGTVQTIVADVTKERDVISLFSAIKAAETLELVVYNVGNNAMVPSLDITKSLFEGMWRQNALGGFLVGKEAIKAMRPREKGTLIYTGATASIRARPPFVAFASAKAALRAVAQGFAREFGPQGIHVAHVVIDGVIDGDYARSKFPAFVKAKGDSGLLNLDDIAEAYWSLHRQQRSAWTHELDLRPFKEPF
ncbi:MAG TPA: SDR family NAD(P)-dependent oxidoreductase [Hyphomicrobium sp.]|nr:SDR family NAD(P)-dependent oxidoreductase [Hyphomicrobium sp.]